MLLSNVGGRENPRWVRSFLSPAPTMWHIVDHFIYPGNCNADHLAILLKPIYTKRLKANRVTVRTVDIWIGSALVNQYDCLEGFLETIFMTTLKLQVNTYIQGTETSTFSIKAWRLPSGKQRTKYATGILICHQLQKEQDWGLETPPYQTASTVLCQIWQTETDTTSKSPCKPEDTALQVTQRQVLMALRQVNPVKAVEPEGVPPTVLTAFTEHLAGVCTDIFNLSLTLAVVPHSFKSSIIILVSKKPETSTVNDWSPVALTLVAMKCLEKLVLTHVNSVVPEWTHYSLPPRSPTDQWTMLWPRLCTLHSNTWTLAEHMLGCSSSSSQET